jgi:hypothetical protein
MQGKDYSRLMKVYPHHVSNNSEGARVDSQIKFMGKWLGHAGFIPNMPILVEVSQGRLVITPVIEREVRHG